VITHKFRRQLDCRLRPQSNCGQTRFVGNHQLLEMFLKLLDASL